MSLIKDTEESTAVIPSVQTNVHYRMRVSSGSGLATDEISLFDILMIFLHHQKVFWITFLSALLLLGAVFLSVGASPVTYQYQQLLKTPYQEKLQTAGSPLVTGSQLQAQWQLDGQAQVQQAMQKNQALQGLRLISANIDRHVLPASTDTSDGNLLPPNMLLLTLKTTSNQGLSDQQRLALSQAVRQILSTFAQPEVTAQVKREAEGVKFLKNAIADVSRLLSSVSSATEAYAQSQRLVELKSQLRSLQFQQKHSYQGVSAVTDLALLAAKDGGVSHKKVLLHSMLCLFLAGFLAVLSVMFMEIKRRFALHRARHLEDKNE